MDFRNHRLFYIGALLIALPLTVLVWLGLPLLAYYIGEIPNRKLILTGFWANNQRRFYEWSSDFLRACFKWTILVLTAPFLVIGFILFVVILILFLAGFPSMALLEIFSGMEPRTIGIVLYIWLFFAMLIAFFLVKRNRYNILYKNAEPTARMLVGTDEYQAMSNQDKYKVLRNIVDSMIGINKATLVVADGKLQIRNSPAGDLAKWGGTGVLIVQEGHAAVLEQSGNISRVVGKGVTFLRMFERVSMVVPLLVRAEKTKIDNVVTQDQVVISSIKLPVYHQVQKGDQSHANGMYPFEDKIILEKIWSPGGSDWRGLVSSVAETTVRDVLARYTLEDLILASDQARKGLSEELRQGIESVTGRVAGVDIVVVAIGEVELPKDVSDKMWKKWHSTIDRQIQVTEAEKQRDVLVRRAEADGKLRKTLEDVKANMVNRLTSPLLAIANAPGQNPEVIQKYFELIEKLTMEIVHDDIAALRYVEALEKVSQSGAQKTVIWADPRQVLDTNTP